MFITFFIVLSICFLTFFIKETKPNFNNEIFKKIFINTPKDVLHKRINARIEAMFKEGVISEVKKFNKMKRNKSSKITKRAKKP